MRRPSRTGLSWLFVACTNVAVVAQDLESIGKEKPLSFSGGLSLSQIFYAARGVDARRDPYSYFASGNVNLSLYGWSVPLSFSVSNHNYTFSQPFNQYSLHPSWKWITVHAGYTSMAFSPYTVNGHIFSGAAIELEPEGNFRFSAFYGRFLKAIEADMLKALASYQRRGYGLKASFGEGSNVIDLIVFRAADDPFSIKALPDTVGITPHENLVVSLAASRRFLKHFVLRAESAASALTKDTRAGKTEHSHPLARSGLLFKPRLSSSYFQAFKTSLDYQLERWIMGIAYERIDPGYRTLGAYYFNNDLENITVNASAGLREGKLNIASSAGVQRDNIDRTKVSTMRRMVGSLNVNYTASRHANLTAAWSSFQTFTNIRPQFETINQLTPYDNLDTLNFTQISQNASLSGMFTLGDSETTRKGLHINLSWQDASDKQGNAQANAGTSFYNINTGYTITQVPRNLSIAITWNTTLNNASFMRTRMFGPSATVSRSFFGRKLRTTFSCSYNQTHTNGSHISTILNGRLNTAVTLRGKHNLSFSTVVVRRAITESRRNSAEVTATLGYNYVFASTSKSKKP